MSRPARVALALGSNLGDRTRNIEDAGQAIAALRETRILRRSRLYQTEPVGGPADQGPFLNAVLLAETGLAPRPLLDALLDIENQLGRVRRERNGPRVIDLDLILYEDRVLDEPGLVIPHPRAHQRAFVLEPLAEVAPDWLHPELGCRIEELWRRLQTGPISDPVVDRGGSDGRASFTRGAGS